MRRHILYMLTELVTIRKQASCMNIINQKKLRDHGRSHQCSILGPRIVQRLCRAARSFYASNVFLLEEGTDQAHVSAYVDVLIPNKQR